MAFSDQGSIDNKQYINLSMDAWAIIEYDQYRFASSDEIVRKIPLSTLLNRIFQNFYEIADASIALQADNYTRELREILSEEETSSVSKKQKKKTVCDEAVIEKLTQAHIRKLQKKSDTCRKGKGERFRLNNHNFEYLTSPDSDCRENLYYSSIGQYLKALFEEYASLTYLERESIYYRPVFETIQQAFDSNMAVRVTHDKGFLFEFQPYQILCDPVSSHHYLTGYSTPINMKVDYDATNQPIPCRARPASIRISNIRDAKLIRRKSGKLTALQKAELKNCLAFNGPQFLTDDTHEIHIRLTQNGIRKYNYQMTLRPDYVKIIEPDIYVFQCSERQIQYYFIEFGKDATILKPDHLRQYFQQWYEAAEKSYGNEDSSHEDR